LFQTAKLQNIC